MTPTELQLRKLRKRFRLLDVSGNGYLELADYEAIASRFEQCFELPRGSEKATLIHATYTRLFQSMHRHGDHDGDGRVDEHEFVQTSVGSLLERPDGFDRAILPVLRAVMHVCDKDADASLDVDELTRFLTAEGAGPEDREQALAHLLEASSERLSFAVFCDATREFYCSANPDAPGNWLFGSV